MISEILRGNNVRKIKLKNKKTVMLKKLKWMTRKVKVISIAQLHSTKPELKFWRGLIFSHGVSEIRDSEYL